MAALPASDLIAKAEVAGAGFISFHLAPVAYARELEDASPQKASTMVAPTWARAPGY